MILRAIERVSPLALYGRPWIRLTYAEQLELVGFESLRQFEDGAPDAPNG